MVERVPAVVYVDASDELSSAIYMSPRAEEMLGYSPQEWLDEPGMWVRLLHEEDRERVLAEQGRTRRTGEPFLAEYRLLAKDGRTVWVRDEAELVEEAGRPPAWHGVLVDVTDRKEAEAALARSEERFRQLVENAGEGIARISPEGRIEYCNPAYAEILGQPRTGRWDGRSSSSWRARTRRRPGASGS
jgi:PAS domain S-box-containing protein